MKMFLSAAVAFAGVASLALTVVTTVAGTVEVIEPVSVEVADYQVELLPGSQASRQVTLNNSAAHPVWAGVLVSVSGGDGPVVPGLSVSVDKDFIAEIPALGSDVWTFTFHGDNGIEPGIYDLEVKVIRPDDSVIATYLDGLAP